MWVFLDIETLDLKGDIILQISAVTENNNKFNIYISPPLNVNQENEITKLFACNGKLYKNGSLLPTYFLKDALKYFRNWLYKFSDVRICAFNGFSFDFGVLIRTFYKTKIGFPSHVVSLCDILPALKRKLKTTLTSYKLTDVAAHYNVSNDDPHNGLYDAVCLKGVCDAFVKENGSDLISLLTLHAKPVEYYFQKLRPPK